MAFEPGVVLEGAAVRLEPLELAHVPALCAIGLDEELWRWTLSQPRDEADMRRYVERALAARAQGSACPFATVDRENSAVVGTTRFCALEPEHRRVEIGYTFVARSHQRSAVNTEAKYLMLRYAFEVASMHRVEFKTDVLNERSRAALRRIGAIEEGVLRGHAITDAGRIRDSVYYSILAPEWPAVRASLEARLRR